jgi:hypothetical protein
MAFRASEQSQQLFPRLRQKTSIAAPLPPAQEDPSLVLAIGEVPYFAAVALLDAGSLCRLDATNRTLNAMNRSHVGPWRTIGHRSFQGLELERHGTFEQPALGSKKGRGKTVRIDWKGRFRLFRKEVPLFCTPFDGAEITKAARPDEVAYFQCRLRTDMLDTPDSQGVYLEVEVLQNPDNLSMAVVDFEAGGCSSVTFSPNTGAVIRERKVREAPRKVEGAYVQPLAMVPSGRRFHGLMGLYLHGGRLAFFRRCDPAPGEEGYGQVGPWETTGFISDLLWAEGRRLTPCLALRDAGAYRVRIVRVCDQPPKVSAETQTPGDGVEWNDLDWEASPGNIDPLAEVVDDY